MKMKASNGHKQPKKSEHTLKRGRGSDRQIEVMVIAEPTAIADIKNLHRPNKIRPCKNDCDGRPECRN